MTTIYKDPEREIPMILREFAVRYNEAALEDGREEVLPLPVRNEEISVWWRKYVEQEKALGR
jgi:hypothetical protein